MHKYKIIVIQMNLKNGRIAMNGEVAESHEFIDDPIELEREKYIVSITEEEATSIFLSEQAISAKENLDVAIKVAKTTLEHVEEASKRLIRAKEKASEAKRKVKELKNVAEVLEKEAERSQRTARK